MAVARFTTSRDAPSIIAGSLAAVVYVGSMTQQQHHTLRTGTHTPVAGATVSIDGTECAHERMDEHESSVGLHHADCWPNERIKAIARSIAAKASGLSCYRKMELFEINSCWMFDE